MPRLATYDNGVLVSVVDDRTLEDAKDERRDFVQAMHEAAPDAARLSARISTIGDAGTIDEVDAVNW